MRNTFYGILAVGLLLFLSSNIYANSTTDCKPSVHIQPVKGNYIPLLNGDLENLEKFLLELAEQNADYCKVSLRIDFKKGLETKQTITRGESRYNEKLFLEVQYFSPSYEAIIENEKGDLLHKIELGKELKSIEYSNEKLNNHDALYTEWRRISKNDLSKIETDANNFQALIDFLKIENGISVPAKPSLEINEKKETLVAKGEVTKVKKKEKSTRKSRRKAKKKSKKIAKTKTQPSQKDNTSKAEKASKPSTKIAKQESKVISKTQPSQKDSTSKVEKASKSPTKIAKQESKVITKTQPSQKDSTSKVEKVSESKVKEIEKSEAKPIEKIAKKRKSQPIKPEVNPTPKVSNNKEKTTTKKESLTDLEKYSPPTTSTEIAKVKKNQPQESSEPREIISDDDMFENVGVAEPLAEMIRFQFPYGKNYLVINESDFSIKINTGRESGKIFNDSSIKPKQEKKLKNKFKNGDWYSIVYPEKLHEKDVENYKESIESILSDLKLSDFEDDFFKMSEQLIPNLDIISNENPLADTSQKEKVAIRFQKFIEEKGIEIFKENQQEKEATQLKELLTLIVQSHRLRHYYKYTVGASATKRPVNKLPRFRKN